MYLLDKCFGYDLAVLCWCYGGPLFIVSLGLLALRKYTFPSYLGLLAVDSMGHLAPSDLPFKAVDLGCLYKEKVMLKYKPFPAGKIPYFKGGSDGIFAQCRSGAIRVHDGAIS